MRSWASHDESYDAFDYFTGAYPDYDDDPLTLDVLPSPDSLLRAAARRASGADAHGGGAHGAFVGSVRPSEEKP